jgi:hypothetical protein
MTGKSFTLKKFVNFLIRLSLIHYNTRIAHMLYKVFVHLRYFLGGHRPSETSILTNLNNSSILLKVL